jgi:hypothetical protein
MPENIMFQTKLNVVNTTHRLFCVQNELVNQKGSLIEYLTGMNTRGDIGDLTFVFFRFPTLSA